MSKRVDDGLSNNKRWQNKMASIGNCNRCGKPLPEGLGSMRVSWKSGKRELIKRKSCPICIESIVRSRLYGEHQPEAQQESV